MNDKHQSNLSFTGKKETSSTPINQQFQNKGVDPILSSISLPKPSNQTKISTIAESIARSLLQNDYNTRDDSSDEYSEEEDHDMIFLKNKEKIKKEEKNNELSNEETSNNFTDQTSKLSSDVTKERTTSNSQIKGNHDLNSSSYEYFEEEEDIDEGKIILQEIELQQEKEKEKKKKEEEEENEINEKISMLNIEIIQPIKEDEKYENIEDIHENDSFQSKFEIIEEEPEQIEIKDEIQIDLKPKELFSSVRNNQDSLSSSSSISPTTSPSRSPVPSSSTTPSKNSNKKKTNQQSIQHRSIFDFTSPKYELKTPDILSLKKSLKSKRKKKPPSVINVNEIKDQETFRKYLNGEFDSPKPPKENYMYYYKQRRHYSSYLSHQDVLDICEKLISTPIEKNKYKFDNPGDISLIIDELKRMKVESITNGDYSRSKKIDDLINLLRTQYRTLDREMFHKASLKGIEKKLDDIKNQIVEMHGKIKEEDQQENEKFKADLAELGVRHHNQLQDLENTWKGPQKAREFNKRSATLLNGQYIERNLALIGEYDEANAVHRMNKRKEKLEARTKHQVLNNSFENARTMMLTEQDKEKERVIKLQNDEKKVKKSFQMRNLEILQKRKAILEIQLENESNIDNFVAKKFKKDKSTVIPMSIVINGSDELVSNSPENARDVENLNTFIATPITTPLPLPPLTISKLKKQKKKSSKKTTL